MSRNIAKTHHEWQAVLRGEDLETYRAEEATRARIWNMASRYINEPSSNWPPIEFNWDLSSEGQRFSLDSMTLSDFTQSYPDGFNLGHVELAEFDRKLCHFSRRDEGELWSVGCTHSLACLIVYLSEGHAISPPLVKPLEDTAEVIFTGGHHRYAIAKEIGVKRIPIYVKPEHKAAVDDLLNIEWEK